MDNQMSNFAEKYCLPDGNTVYTGQSWWNFVWSWQKTWYLLPGFGTGQYILDRLQM